MSRVTGSVAVVTGAGTGVGAAIALQLGLAGHTVIVADIARAEESAAALEEEGVTAISVTTDVSDHAELARLLEIAIARFGGVEVLVNCAAITQARPLLEITPEELRRVLAVNVGGTFQASQVFGAHMAERGYGRIINIASLAGQNGGTATGGHYATSKGAILACTKVFARELASRGVTVNAIAPGPHETDTVTSLVGSDAINGFVRAIPVGTLGKIAFLGKMAVLLADRDAAFVTGATWDVNGGLYVR